MTETIQVAATISRPADLPLRRNRQFQTLWAGSAAAALGLNVADVAYPLAILAVTGSPAETGLFAAVQALGMIVAGLPAGQLVDRRSPRTVLIIAETGRALVTAAVAVAVVLGALPLPLLMIAAALLGIAQPVVSAARLLLVRAAVPKQQLTRALTRDEVRVNGAQLAGPPLGGALYGLRVLAHAAPFVFTAGSFVLSLLSALLAKPGPARAIAAPDSGDGGASGGSGMLAGVTLIWRNPTIRAATLLIAMVNMVGASLDLIAIVILRDQSAPPAMIGVALAGAAVGGLAGTPLVRPLHRLRPGVLLIAVCVTEVPLFALLAVPYGALWMAGVLFASMLGVPAIRVLLNVLILRQAPESERGRVVGAVMTLMGIGMPVGLAVGGLLLQILSAQTTMLILAGALTAGVLCCAAKPALWHARWPEA